MEDPDERRVMKACLLRDGADRAARHRYAKVHDEQASYFTERVR